MDQSRKDNLCIFFTVCHCDVEIGIKEETAVYRHSTTNDISPHFLAKSFFGNNNILL